MSKLIIKIGERKGILTSVKEGARKRLPSGQTNRTVDCVCDCGREKNIRLVHWSRGSTLSCGCVNRLINKAEYSKEDKYILRIYKAIKDRCSPNAIDSHIYYDRGIKMCEEWVKTPRLFFDWAIDNGLKKGLQIDRIDNNKGYSEQNCRVVTPRQNANNRGVTTIVNYKGREYAYTYLLDLKGLSNNYSAIRGRLSRGWSIEDAFDTPIKEIKSKYKKKADAIQGG